jgi:hypothetical protein
MWRRLNQIFLRQEPNDVVIPLPNFDDFQYKYAIAPDKAKLKAWNKLRETERRFRFYAWVEPQTHGPSSRHRVLLDDSISAYLLTFEATIQFLKEEFGKPFEDWLRKQEKYSITVKALRTYRNFEAHVEAKPVSKMAMLSISSGFGVEKQIVEHPTSWHFPDIEYAPHKPRVNHLASEEAMNAWNIRRPFLPVAEILLTGLQDLREILVVAEDILNSDSVDISRASDSD